MGWLNDLQESVTDIAAYLGNDQAQLVKSLRDAYRNDPKTLAKLERIMEEPGADALFDKLLANPDMKKVLGASLSDPESGKRLIDGLHAAAVQDGNVFEVINRKMEEGGLSTDNMVAVLQTDPAALMQSVNDAATLAKAEATLDQATGFDGGMTGLFEGNLRDRMFTEDGNFTSVGQKLAQTFGGPNVTPDEMKVALAALVEQDPQALENLNTIMDGKGLEPFMSTLANSKNETIQAMMSGSDPGTMAKNLHDLAVRVDKDGQYMVKASKFLREFEEGGHEGALHTLASMGMTGGSPFELLDQGMGFQEQMGFFSQVFDMLNTIGEKLGMGPIGDKVMGFIQPILETLGISLPGMNAPQGPTAEPEEVATHLVGNGTLAMTAGLIPEDSMGPPEPAGLRPGMSPRSPAAPGLAPGAPGNL
ncbi:MAG: hypothetical protein KDJ15_01390 [Alphaproteobacteria bacterium]|nr:hypothetical protein [Alphaproteobacteria bacterium]